MVRSFTDWLENANLAPAEGTAANPKRDWDTRSINDFFLENKYAPSYRNRTGTELLRFSKLILNQPANSLDFLRALQPLDEREAMPLEHRRRLNERLEARVSCEKNWDWLDVCLAFMSRYAARPNEALKLASGYGDFWHVSSLSKAPRKAQCPLLVPLTSREKMEAEFPGVESYWHAALTAKQTKTKAPYVWVVPSKIAADDRVSTASPPLKEVPSAAEDSISARIRQRHLQNAGDSWLGSAIEAVRTQRRKKIGADEHDPAANPCFKNESGLLQTRLSQVLKQLNIPPPENEEGKNWTLKALRQNAAMEAAQQASKAAAGRKLQHQPGSQATNTYLLERPPCLQGP